ncbi:ribonuclease H-like domain-containing protein [Tanacetum coccineum]|uniref:Ribonuclease H-like domain-containing protein n=1 Tax=Tanacetum coccineum TaxID=301880 RepID=A0ABQ5J8P0_9ASTR
MKRVSKGYSGVDFHLFPTMITTPESSPSRITSSPSLSPQTYQSPLRDITRQDAKIPQSQFPTQTQIVDEAAFTSVDVDAGEAATTDISLEAGQGSGTMHKTPTRPHYSPLPRVYTLRCDEGSLQQNELIDLVTKTNKSRRRTRIVISEDEDAEEDSSKQGRKISKVNKDPTISLVQPEHDMEYDFDVSTAEGFTTANVPVTTASATPEVSTAAANLVYIRRSAEKRKDKGKAIMKEDESVQKKTKKQLEQERLGHEDAIRLDPAMLRYHAHQNRSFSVAEARKNMCMYLKNRGGYKQSHFKGMSYEDIRPIFERVWDQNNAFVPKDSEIEKEVMKRPGFDFQQKSSKKRSREDSDEDNAKKQKLEDDAEKKELRDSMDVVPRDDIAIDVESLATKYPIVDWKTHVLTENMMYYQIIRADGSSKNYKIFSEMLDDFDRQDVLDLHRLVQERYDTTSPEGYDLLLWGDLKILFEPNEEDEIWKNQQDYNLISWRLFDSCGIHMLLMHTGIAIHMMIEKKYPLTQEMLSRMLSRRLEVDQESEMAFELLRSLMEDMLPLEEDSEEEKSLVKMCDKKNRIFIVYPPSMNVSHDEPEPSCDAEKKDDEGVSKASGVDDQERPESSTPNINTAGPSINTASANLRTGSLHINTVSPTVLTTRSNRPQSVSDIISLRDNVTPEATNADLFGDETEMDMSNLNASYHVPTTPNTRIHKDHSLDHVIGDIQSSVQTRGMTKTANEQGLLSVAYERKPHEDLNTCLFFCFLSQEEPKRVTKALSDSAWVEAMQEELLQFKLQKVWVLVDLPKGKRAIGTKWIFRNKKDERGIVIRNKARLVAQGYTQEEGIDYDEVFAPVARIESIRLFLAYASFMGFMVYQIDVKSAFLYGQIEEDTAITPRDTEKSLLKISDGDDVDCQLIYVNDWIIDSTYITRPDMTLLELGLDRKTKTEVCQFQDADCYHGNARSQLLLPPPIIEAEHVKRGRDTKIPQSSGPPIKVGDEAVHKELGDKMERAATTASSFGAEQDSDAQTSYSRTTDDRRNEITASIDCQVKTITEASLRRHLKLEDSDGTHILLMSNMKRDSRGYSEVDYPLFPTIITTPESSPSRITSSPSLSHQTYQSPLRDITRQDAKIP